MSWTKNVSSYFFRFRETSGSESQSLPWRSRRIQVTIYQWYCYLFIVIMFLIFGYFNLWSVHTESAVLVRKIYIYFVPTVERNRKFLYANHISYDWWKSVSKQGISFSLRKPTRWKIYLRQPQNSLTMLSVKIAADQPINLFAESSLSNRWELSNFDKQHAHGLNRLFFLVFFLFLNNM